MLIPVVKWCKALSLNVRGVAFVVNDAEAGAYAALFKSHTDRSAVNRVGITVRRIEKIESLFGKIEPPVFVKIFCVVSTDYYLEIALPFGDHIVKWFGRRCEIIGLVDALLVEVDMNLGQPLVVFRHACLAFFL